jgi:hypothetical protein
MFVADAAPLLGLDILRMLASLLSFDQTPPVPGACIPTSMALWSATALVEMSRRGGRDVSDHASARTCSILYIGLIECVDGDEATEENYQEHPGDV